jgi:anti-sigma B factor antagonist
MDLSVTSKQKMDGVYMLSPDGRLDTTTYPVLEARVEVVLQEKPHTLVFDMEMLEYISSMGVRVIAKAQKTMKAYNGKVVLLNLQPQIQKCSISSKRYHPSRSFPTWMSSNIWIGCSGRLPDRN